MSNRSVPPLAADVLMLPLGAAQLGGAERSIAELAMQLRARKKSVLLLADRALESTPYAAELAAGDVPVQWMDWHPGNSRWKNFLLAWRTFRRWRAPLIHFNVSWRPRLWVVPLAARLANPRARLIGTIRSMPDSHHDLPRKRYFGIIPSARLWLLPGKFNGWIWGRLLMRTVSINQADFPPRLASDYYFPARNIRVVQNGIPPRRHAQTPEEKRQLRQQAGMQSGDVFVLYAGRLADDKGIDDLLQAMQALPPHYRLAVIGTGPQAGELTAMASRLGIEARVNFLGFQPNPRDWMAAADMVIVPSSQPEPFGRTVIEAMAEDSAVIASRIGGMGEIFTDGEHGLYFPARDVQALTRAISALGEDPARRALLVRQAGELFRARYSVERVRRQYMQLYQEIAPRQSWAID